MEQRDNWRLTESVFDEVGQGDPFAAAMRASRMAMIITDPRKPDNPIIFVNEAFQLLTGYSREEVIGRNCRFLQGKDTDQATLMEMGQAIEAGQAFNVELVNYRKDGTPFWNALCSSPVMGEDGSIHYHVGSQIDVTERIEARDHILAQRVAMEEEIKSRTAELEDALEAKTILLYEVDHRVKNNLMMIGSLLRLEARSMPDPHLRETLREMLQRVDALATLHRRLYQSNDIAKFDIGAFAVDLANDLIGACGRQDIELDMDIETVEISSKKAAPVGLILNEIITNAIKHAYANGRSGRLSLSVRKSAGQAVIDLRDDGPGLIAKAKTELSIGWVLVERLSKQAKAIIVWNDNAPGTHVCISFAAEG